MIVDEGANRFSFAFPSDKRRQLNRQVLTEITERFERWEFFSKLWMPQLKHVFGLGDISEPMLTQIDKRRIFGERSADDPSRDTCNKNLLAVPDVSDARRAIHVRTTF